MFKGLNDTANKMSGLIHWFSRGSLEQFAAAVGAGVVHHGRAIGAEGAFVAADAGRVFMTQLGVAFLANDFHLQHDTTPAFYEDRTAISFRT